MNKKMYGFLSPKVNILQIKKICGSEYFENKTKQLNILEFLFERFSVINEERAGFTESGPNELRLYYEKSWL